MAAALRGTATDRNTIINRSTDSAMTAPMNHGSRLEILSDMSMKMAVCPPTCTSAPGASDNARGMTSSRSRWTRLVVAPSGGAGGGAGRAHRGGAAVFGLARGHRLHARVMGDRRLERAEVVDGGAVELDGEQQRPVEPGPEPVGQQVVRPAGGHRRGGGAVVGHAPAHD